MDAKTYFPIKLWVDNDTWAGVAKRHAIIFSAGRRQAAYLFPKDTRLEAKWLYWERSAYTAYIQRMFGSPLIIIVTRMYGYSGANNFRCGIATIRVGVHFFKWGFSYGEVMRGFYSSFTHAIDEVEDNYSGFRLSRGQYHGDITCPIKYKNQITASLSRR